MNGKDLSWVESFTEYVNGSQLTTKHPVSVRRLWWTQETLVVALKRCRAQKQFSYHIKYLKLSELSCGKIRICLTWKLKKASHNRFFFSFQFHYILTPLRRNVCLKSVDLHIFRRPKSKSIIHVQPLVISSWCSAVKNRGWRKEKINFCHHPLLHSFCPPAFHLFHPSDRPY